MANTRINFFDGFTSETVPSTVIASGPTRENYTFSFLNNVSTAADITNFSFDNNFDRAFQAQLVVDRSGDGLDEVFNIQGVLSATGWDISIDSTGGDSGIEFDMTPSGQMQYTSSNLTSGGTMKFFFDKNRI